MKSTFVRLAIAAVASLSLTACGSVLTQYQGEVPAAARAAFPSCRFIDASRTPRHFITEAYMTDAGSALAEGATAGAFEGFSSASDLADPMRSLTPRSFHVGSSRLVETPNISAPVCAILPGSVGASRRAASAIMSELASAGYRTSAYGDGLQTDWRRREHRAARWLDRITFSFRALGQAGTVVSIQRDVYIQRRESWNQVGDGTLYFEGSSDGGNEAFLLGEIRRRLR